MALFFANFPLISELLYLSSFLVEYSSCTLGVCFGRHPFFIQNDYVVGFGLKWSVRSKKGGFWGMFYINLRS